MGVPSPGLVEMRSLCPAPRFHWISGSYAAMIGAASVTITTPCNLYTSAGQRFLQAPRRATGRNTRRIGSGEEVTDGGGLRSEDLLVPREIAVGSRQGREQGTQCIRTAPASTPCRVDEKIHPPRRSSLDTSTSSPCGLFDVLQCNVPCSTSSKKGGLPAPSFLGARLIGKFKLGDSLQARDTLTDRFRCSEYCVSAST
jgi:hypothetical protein